MGSRGPGFRRFAALALTSAALIAGKAHAQQLSTEAGEGLAEEVIVVTGSRLPRASFEEPSPVQVLTADDLGLSALPNLEQTLNQLPQLVGGFTSTSNNPGSGAATLDLRGLGATRTLILVNGRRWIASDAGDVPEVDINTIPAALIERVEIVTGGASTVYGSDAVTGVVNFIMRDSLDGLRAQARQSVTGRGDGAVASLDMSGGLRALDDRLSVTASVGWLEQRAVMQGDRTLSRVSLTDGCGVPGTRQPTGASQPLPPTACPGAGEITLVAGGSPTIPGTRIIGAAFFPAGPSALTVNGGGLRFDPDGTPRPFLVPFDLYNFAPDNYLQIPFRRYSANLFASFAASEAFVPYVELAHIDTASVQQLAPVPAVIGRGTTAVPLARINLDNPFLTPAAREVLDLSYGIDLNGARGTIGSPATGPRRNPAYLGDADGVIVLPAVLQSRLDLGPRQVRHARKAYRVLGGVRGRVGSQWHYDAYLSYSKVDHVSAYRNSGSATRLQQTLLAVIDPATGRPACIDPSGGCVPANIFGAGNLSAEAADFLRTHPRDFTAVEETVAEASVRRGFDLDPQRRLDVVLGVNWRRTAYDFQPDPALFTGDDLGFLPGVPASGATRSAEIFLESRVPLTSAVVVELGGRLSHYAGLGEAVTWKAIGSWEAWSGLRFRGGYQRAVRAPNARELFEAPVTFAGSVVDPCDAIHGRIDQPEVRTACLRNGVPAAVLGNQLIPFALVTTSGNPDLAPEIAQTWTLGATARWPSARLALAVDFYDIAIRRAIGTFGGGPNFAAIGCIARGGDRTDPLCSTFTRGPDGSIDRMILPTANTGLLSARGVDWQLYWRRSLGLSARSPSLSIKLAGTHYLRSGFKLDDVLPYIDCAGQFGGSCGNTIGGTAIPRWKLFNSAELDFGVLDLSLRHRWFSATRDSRTLLTGRLGLDPPVLPEQGRVLEARHYFDLSARMRFGEGRQLVLGVSNLLDARPAVTGALQVQANTDPSLYDVLGRRFFATLDLAY